jgi:hypothetical protein
MRRAESHLFHRKDQSFCFRQESKCLSIVGLIGSRRLAHWTSAHARNTFDIATPAATMTPATPPPIVITSNMLNSQVVFVAGAHLSKIPSPATIDEHEQKHFYVHDWELTREFENSEVSKM